MFAQRSRKCELTRVKAHSANYLHFIIICAHFDWLFNELKYFIKITYNYDITHLIELNIFDQLQIRSLK